MVQKSESPYPQLLIQAEEGCQMLMIAIAAEKQLFSAGSSLCEALDRLFKLYWIFNVCYEPGSEVVFNFLQSLYGLEYGSLPKSIMEIESKITPI